MLLTVSSGSIHCKDLLLSQSVICVCPLVLAVCPCGVCEALLSDDVLLAWCDMRVCEMQTADRGVRVCPCNVHGLLHCLSIDPSSLTIHAVCQHLVFD